MTKTCSKCSEIKDVSEFYKYLYHKDGLHSACKKCHYATVKEWRKNNVEKWNVISRKLAAKYRETTDVLEKNRKYKKVNGVRLSARNKERWREIKYEIFSHYCGGEPICMCCGEKNMEFLSLDHINNDGAEHRRSMRLGKKGGGMGSGTQLYYWIRRNKYPLLFQILCMNCNCGKAKNDGVCPHKLSDKVID